MQERKQDKAKSMEPTVRGKRAVALMAAGKTGKDAMVAAGYSRSAANNPGTMLKRKRMAAYLARLAPLANEDMIHGTTARAMVEGTIPEALQGATLAAKLRGLLVERSQNVNVNVDGADGIAAMRDELARLYAGDTLPRPGSEPDLKSQAQRASAAATPPVDRDSNDA